MMRVRSGLLACVMAGAMLLGGCGASYTLRGKVVSGPQSSVMVVAADDPRLAGPGVDGATIQLTLDPQSLGRKPLGSGSSLGDGTFEIPIHEFGMGTLEYQLGVLAQHEGYVTAQEQFATPGGGQRVLITLAKGRDTYRPPDNPLDGAEPYLHR